ncbi:MAG: chemotaxis protein CheB [Chloroflexi bacterium]|nr:chemotaxis protein CheB [Chloroflexota bacterium]
MTLPEEKLVSREIADAVIYGPSNYATLSGRGRPTCTDPCSNDLAIKILCAFRQTLKASLNPDATRARLRTVVNSLSASAPRPGRFPSQGPSPRPSRRSLVAIAASTGGPAALQVVFSHLPPNLSATLVVIMHLAPGFLSLLCDRLSEHSRLPVHEAEDGMLLEQGTVLVAPPGLHLRIVRRQTRLAVTLDPEPKETPHRPSANITFESIASCCASETCAVILTGIGDDGATGMKAIHNRGGYTIAQDRATSVVYGMPGQAVELGAVDVTLPLDQIADEILRVTTASASG